MMSKIFSFAVAAALLYLVQQQFPQEAREVLEWADARIEAVTSRTSSWGGEVPDASESGLRAEVEPPVTEPSAGDTDVVAATVAATEVHDTTPAIPVRREPPAVDLIPPVTGESAPGAQATEVDPVSPSLGAEHRLDRDTVRIRRDALAALAERMETLAIERAF